MQGMRHILILILTAAPAFGAPRASAGPPRILCTTFPIYQITRNVTARREGVRVDLMLPAGLGCPHHYVLTPGDMRKLARADVLVVNGLGMEGFMGAPLDKANPDIEVVESAEGILDLLPYHDAPHAEHGAHGDAHDSGAMQNPHLFVSPRMAALLAVNIAAGLAAADPEGAQAYRAAAHAYAGRLHALADAMAARVRTFRNRRIAQPHGVFDYLARDIGLEIVAVTQPHGLAPSAAGMRTLAETLRAAGAGAVFTEPQYDAKVGRTLAREIGIPVAVLDPVATGPEDAPLDYYERTMRRNLETMARLLGPAAPAPSGVGAGSGGAGSG
jgi:zinc transport system substrate-binding protein